VCPPPTKFLENKLLCKINYYVKNYQVTKKVVGKKIAPEKKQSEIRNLLDTMP